MPPDPQDPQGDPQASQTLADRLRAKVAEWFGPTIFNPANAPSMGGPGNPGMRPVQPTGPASAPYFAAPAASAPPASIGGTTGVDPRSTNTSQRDELLRRRLKQENQ